MNSRGIRRAALLVLVGSVLFTIIQGHLPLQGYQGFFIGAFGYGSGVVLLIVANIIAVNEQIEAKGNPYMQEYKD